VTTISGNTAVAVAGAAASDVIFVTNSGSIVLGSDAVTNLFNDVTVIVNGTVVSSVESGILLGQDGGTQVSGNNLTIGSLGSVYGAERAVGLYGSQTQITNNGIVSGQQDGIYLEGGENTLVNTGVISALAGYAVEFNNTTNHNFLVNSGQITSNAYGVQLGDYTTLTNTGLIAADGYGVNGSDYNTIDNSGTITGGSAMSFGGFSNAIFNSGTINGPSNTLIYFSNASGENNLYNTGDIITNGMAIAAAGLNGEENIYNSGNITGDISLGGGDDLYDGRGGTLDGSISGGNGDDVYYIDDADTLINEVDGGGDDTLHVGSGYRLAATLFIETLRADGDSDFKLVGNLEDNSIYGNLGDDLIRGADGDDWLEGGVGGDIINGGAGIDSAVYTESTEAVSVDLETGGASGGDAEGDVLKSIEWLEGSAYDDELLGDDASNVLTGGDGNDILNGRAGDDKLQGGDGDDTYVVDSVDDDIVEALANGTDKIKASVTYTLDDADEIENLTLTGSKDIDGTGNNYDNGLTGNSGDNLLKGLDGKDSLNGGKGEDRLTGGGDADTFVFGKDFGKDTINDFNAGTDLINLDAINDIIMSFSDLKNHHASQSGANLVIDAGGGDTITVKGVTIDDLDATDFIFNIT
jgi:hypothetical protein